MLAQLLCTLTEQQYLVKFEENPANKDYIRVVLHDVTSKMSQGANLQKYRISSDAICKCLKECQTRLEINRKIR